MSTGYNNPDYLYRLARSGSAEDREKLAKSISSLLQADLSKGELYLAQDILLHLLREAETDLRQTLALHLSVEPKCPKALIDYLIFECPLSVSEPVLKNSPVLVDDDLIEIDKRFETPEYWRAIASREQVSKNLALFLIGTDDDKVYDILVRNLGTEFCSLCMNWLTGIAMNMPPLQEPLLQRKEITAEMATKLYWHTSEQLQTEILQKFDIDKSVLDKAMQYVVSRRVEQKQGIQRVSDEMWQIAQKLPKISSRQIMDAMQKGDRAFFACLCATHLKIDAERVLQKLEARPMLALAVLTRAIGMTRAEYNSLFLMWRRQDNTGSITNAGELTHAMAVFDQMKADQAKAEAASWSNTATSNATH